MPTARRLFRTGKPHSDPVRTGIFTTTTDGQIIDPNGQIFIPVGANVGSAIGGDHQCTATGHSADVQAWGWNAIRLFVVQTTAISWTLPAQSLASTGSAASGYNQVFQIMDSIVSEYTSKGIVVLIDNHDLFEIHTELRNSAADMEGLANPYIGEIDQFWRDCAMRYKNNTYVWYNLDNEPVWSNNQTWIDLHVHHLDIVRSYAPDNIVVFDAMVGGGDLGPQNDSGLQNTKLTTDPTMGPAVIRNYKNIVLSMHNYGGYDMYTAVSKYMKYVESVRTKLHVPLLIGEIGYSWDGSQADAGLYINNYNGAISAFESVATTKVGVFWWHATINTPMSLKNNGGGFYTGGLNVNLSDGGQRLWNLGHDLGSEPQNLTGTNNGPTITVSWQLPMKDTASLSGFKLYRNGTLLATLNATTFSFTDTTSEYGFTYLYQIKAVTNGIERSTSFYLQYVAVGGSAPAPTNLAASVLSGTANIQLTWNAPSPITGVMQGYNIYRNGGLLNTSGPWTYGNSFVDYNRTSGTTYQYKVAAVVDNLEQPAAQLSYTMP